MSIWTEDITTIKKHKNKRFEECYCPHCNKLDRKIKPGIFTSGIFAVNIFSCTNCGLLYRIALYD